MAGEVVRAVTQILNAAVRYERVANFFDWLLHDFSAIDLVSDFLG